MRDWAALPHDVGYEIFCRLPHVAVLRGAGLVCASWRRLAVDDPMLWRHIDIAIGEDVEKAYFDSLEPSPGELGMAHAAVDRSAGRCESFRGPADCYLLLYLTSRAPLLSSLHVTSFFRLNEVFVDRVIPRLAMLERLVLRRGLTIFATLRAFLDNCPRLQLLDAGGCYAEGLYDSSFEAWLSETRTLKVLTMPRQWLPDEPIYSWMLAEDDYEDDWCSRVNRCSHLL